MGEKPVEDAQRRYGTQRVEGVLMTLAVRLELAGALKRRGEDVKHPDPEVDRDQAGPARRAAGRGHPELLYPTGPRLFDHLLGRGAGERMPPVPRKRWRLRGLVKPVSRTCSVSQSAAAGCVSSVTVRVFFRTRRAVKQVALPEGLTRAGDQEAPTRATRPDGASYGRIGDHCWIFSTCFAVLVWTPNAPVA